MQLADTKQHFLDWLTQEWVILFGRKFDPTNEKWLIGPFGEIDGIGEAFIQQLANKEQLSVVRNQTSTGLLSSIKELNLHEEELARLSNKVIDFYENTANYELHLNVKWNPIFKIFGFLVNRLFSRRINQLNIPLKNVADSKLTSEIIQLVEKESRAVKYTIWLRKIEKTGQVIYSGVYGTTILPSKQTCIKAVFPLPKGNATVIMKPSVGEDNELILDSSGRTFNDAGFYFLLNDVKGNFCAKFVASFTDKLIVKEENGLLKATQTLKLWNLKVAQFNYKLLAKIPSENQTMFVG